MSAAYTLDRDAPLRARNTFRVEASAAWLATVADPAALPEVLDAPGLRGLPVLVLGEGSNVLFAAARYDGVVCHLVRRDVRLLEESPEHALVEVDAAYHWDTLVDWTLGRGLCGLENLALIPGQAGTAPIQNIGAYGVEISAHVAAVQAFERVALRPVRLEAAACGFGYRDSIFRRDPDRWIVTGLELHLARSAPAMLEYAGLREELLAMGDAEATPRNVAAAVRRIRRRKLPDPAAIGNAGSFFKNPVVASELASRLRDRYATLPVFPASREHERKLSAAWLIEQAGWRGVRDGHAGISSQHALVLVNHGAASGAELLSLARRVADSVERTFGVRLEPEPRIVGESF